MTTLQFQKTILNYYRANRRNLPWRKTKNPYCILISEIMLQQTQVPRVISKYREFLNTFPTIQSLNRAPLRKVLKVWQGLGYNRRALYLKQAARIIVKKHKGCIPQEVETLEKLPGIGRATAAAILVYAFSKPIPFIETNVRTVFIHHFFSHKRYVEDNVIFPFVRETMNIKNPREWFSALMDYGTFLKKEYGNASGQSKYYSKQPPFKGSLRELRGAIIRALTNTSKLTEKQIIRSVGKKISRAQLSQVLQKLLRDNLIIFKNNYYQIST